MNAHVKDLLLRAGHTFWESFTAAFVAAYLASGVDVSQVVDMSSAKKAGLALLAAAGASALSAVKTTVSRLVKPS